MNDFLIHETAIVKATTGDKDSAIYKDCRVERTQLDQNATIGDRSRIFDSKLKEHVAIQRNSLVYNTEFGRYTYTGKNFTSWHSKIGAFCSISWNVSIGGANHDYRRMTTHSFLYSPEYECCGDEPGYDRFDSPCIIGNDVWIGANACICRGVTVGNGAVIGAGAVVTHDVQPYSIVAGVPAAMIKMRFSEEIIKILSDSEWWNLPINTIKENFELFNHIVTKESAISLKEICSAIK